MFKNLTVAVRLGIGFGIIVSLLVAALWFSLARLSTVNQLMDQVVQEDWQKAVLANESALLMNSVARQSFSLITFHDFSVIEQIEADRAAITARVDRLRQLVNRPEGIELLNHAQKLRENYVTSYLKVIEVLRSGDQQYARELMQTSALPALDKLLPAMRELVDLQGRVLQSNGQKVHEYYEQSQKLIWLFMLLAWLISTSLAWWIIRSVTRPLGGEPHHVKAAVERIANGDLKGELNLKPGDNHSLMAAMVRMQSSLRDMLQTLMGNADNVAGASLQLAAASKQINVSSAEQTAASTSMASAVEQMSTSIGLVSGNANEALSITDETRTLSSNGELVFRDTVASMRRITESVDAAAHNLSEMEQHARNISGIVQLISDVAEQTNLLALNAAIEAARAGEAGRGFAVVADEVRQLAERTSKATVEIIQMIDKVQGSASAAEATMSSVVTQVGEGMALAERAGESMQGIGRGAQQVLDSVDKITSTLSEQNSASEEIAERIEQVAHMSEENHQAITEVMQTAALLEQLAAQTQGAVRRFQL